MLVLNRNLGESIQIDDNIKLTICGTQSNQVKVGIDAPRQITIMREELLNAKTAHNIDNETFNKISARSGKPQVSIKIKQRKRIVFPEQ